jgi:hypothetical protein
VTPPLATAIAQRAHDPWDVDLADDAASSPAYGQGSNVDLGVEAEEIRRALWVAHAALDAIQGAAVKADEEAAAVREQLREEADACWRSPSVAAVHSRYGVTVAKARVEALCRIRLRELEEVKALQERCRAAQRAVEVQASIAQSLAKMWLAQYEQDHGRRGAR